MTNDAQTANAPLTVQELAEIAARLAAVTPGEWVWRDGDTLCAVFHQGKYPYGKTIIEPTYSYDAGAELKVDEADSNFIAHAPTDLRRLLADLQRAHDERDTLVITLEYLSINAEHIVRELNRREAIEHIRKTIAAALKGDTP